MAWFRLLCWRYPSHQHFLEKVHGDPPGTEGTEAEAQRTDLEEDGGDDGELI